MPLKPEEASHSNVARLFSAFPSDKKTMATSRTILPVWELHFLKCFYLAGAVTEFDKRVAVANARSKSEWRRSDFDKKVLALANKVDAAQKKANDQVPLTKEEQALVDESKTGTPFPIMTDKDTTDMRSALITTQTATRREGGGYLLRRSFYPQEGFFIRESINEEELEKMPAEPEVPEKISSNTVTYEYVWSDNLIGDLAINVEAPARGSEERMVA